MKKLVQVEHDSDGVFTFGFDHGDGERVATYMCISHVHDAIFIIIGGALTLTVPLHTGE